MWNEPYLETCCRSALHRLVLVQGHGRPDGLKDGPCLNRLGGMGMAIRRDDGRWQITATGRDAHGLFTRATRAGAAAAAGAASAPAR